MSKEVALPDHLKVFISQQDHEQYTPLEHSTWRYILRQLKHFLSVHGHESYLEGLEKTGITTEQIPSISSISKNLEKFGWRAIPVSGFIPPSAFMELQAMSILPIASEMRSLEHILYTPAPDIVHEAAGHAPILVHPDFSNYLKKYAQMAKNAIISSEDLKVYECIRILSDLKEDPSATVSEIAQAELELKKATQSITHISEAALLSRMYWWTAEYGLMEKNGEPKIYGAGLLSSLSESRDCIKDQVKKIPFSLACIDYSYDITEPQPQLFVSKDFTQLSASLNELENTMAYKRGGLYSLSIAKKSQTVNTVVFENGLRISGILTDYILDSSGEAAIFIRWQGRVQISYGEKEIPGQGIKRHPNGFSTPLGLPEKEFINTSWQKRDPLLLPTHFPPGFKVHWLFKSEIELKGEVKSTQLINDSSLIIITFKNCSITYKGEILFDPSWGEFDWIHAQNPISVFAGPNERNLFGETENYIQKKVKKPVNQESQKQLFNGFLHLSQMRKKNPSPVEIEKFYHEFMAEINNNWLLNLEAYEMALVAKSSLAETLLSILNYKKQTQPELNFVIDKGLELAKKEVQ